MKITESCACGATFEAIGPDYQVGSLGDRAAEWRAGHKHAESVGICGTPSPRIARAGVPDEWSPLCDLKAGHPGMHHACWPDGGEGHWTIPSAEETP